MTPVLPGSTLGIFGSGQLGRMLAFEAKRLGYTVHVFSPGENTPAGQVADVELSAPYEDAEAVQHFANSVDVITVEFENIPVEALELAHSLTPVHPSPNVLHIAQNRLREKRFLYEQGLPVTPFRELSSAEALDTALNELGTPAVMKTAGFGYDGKGQAIVETLEEAREAYKSLGGGTVILESFITYQQEISVIAARSATGEYADFGVIENDHENHILDVSVAPSTLPETIQKEALRLTRAVLESLDVVGVMCVEFFLTEEGALLINEVAPRPHNSGHLTIEGCVTSQFEQQLRAVCGLPLGATDFVRPVAIANLLGDVWQQGEPDWEKVLEMKGVYLHLYGKAEARVGRKMGHLTALGETVEEAREKVVRARAVLSPPLTRELGGDLLL